jgi:hypothetical protein
MPVLLSLDQPRRDREIASARLVEAGTRHWRKAWLMAYLQCLALMLAGYVLYGLSWGRSGDEAVLISALGFVVAYALPFFRLIAFFLRHADQF